MLYDMKQRKDIELEKAKFNFRVARRDLIKNRDDNISLKEAQSNLNESREKASIAFESFIIAYRIDPKDPEMQLLRDEMEKLEKFIISEDTRLKVTIAQRERAEALKALALAAMDERRYQDALGHWEEILTFLPQNIEAIEGSRQAQLAIENAIKYESIRRYMASGVALFNQNEFNLARQDFINVLQIDPANTAADEYIDRIDERLNERRRLEQRMRQAEVFYASGINNIGDNNFDQARDDFENALALVPDYKDSRARLLSLPGLRKEFERRERERRLRLIDTEFQNGLIALTQQKYQEAISYFEKTLNLDPENQLASVYIQRAKEALKQIEEEIVDDNSPYFDLVNSLVVSGEKLYNEGKYEESKKRWEKILELFPKNRKATEFVLKCEMKLNPERRETFAQRLVAEGNELLGKREFRDAQTKFELVKSFYPEYPEIDTLIARSERSRGATGGGTVSLGRADRNELERRYRLGMTYYQRGGAANLNRALAELRWVVSRDPENIKAIVGVNRIESQLRSGTSSASTVAQKGLTPEQEALVRRYYYRGINYYSNNDFNRAIAEWRKVLAIDPNHVNARNNIRRTLVLLGR
jgi:tetratricopeptide (TPR) repeat protein